MSIQRSLLLFAALTCLAFALSPARAATPPYDAIYVFGGSYCDEGNVFAATSGAIPAAPYDNGRFSHGPIWVDHVASVWGLTITPALKGGTDYAFGGAYVTSAQVTLYGTVQACRSRSSST
jgi:phospholipase/lecithinase/hemolysin